MSVTGYELYLTFSKTPTKEQIDLMPDYNGVFMQGRQFYYFCTSLRELFTTIQQLQRNFSTTFKDFDTELSSPLPSDHPLAQVPLRLVVNFEPVTYEDQICYFQPGERVLVQESIGDNHVLRGKKATIDRNYNPAHYLVQGDCYATPIIVNTKYLVRLSSLWRIVTPGYRKIIVCNPADFKESSFIPPTPFLDFTNPRLFHYPIEEINNQTFYLAVDEVNAKAIVRCLTQQDVQYIQVLPPKDFVGEPFPFRINDGVRFVKEPTRQGGMVAYDTNGTAYVHTSTGTVAVSVEELEEIRD